MTAQEKVTLVNASKEILRKPYARVLVPDENGGFFAEILEFPGCFAEGETAEQAYEQLEKAAESWIEAALEMNQEIPAPLAGHDYSGKVALRLPKSLHKKAAFIAEQDGVSLNQFFVYAIAERVGEAKTAANAFQTLTGWTMPITTGSMVAAGQTTEFFYSTGISVGAISTADAPSLIAPAATAAKVRLKVVG